ncbi:MAG: hypothetical protein U0470_07765 [Anaerolineae bacterium]
MRSTSTPAAATAACSRVGPPGRTGSAMLPELSITMMTSVLMSALLHDWRSVSGR